MLGRRDWAEVRMRNIFDIGELSDGSVCRNPYTTFHTGESGFSKLPCSEIDRGVS